MSGELFRKRRERAHVGRSPVAAWAGVDTSIIRRFERGAFIKDERRRARIYDAYNRLSSLPKIEHGNKRKAHKKPSEAVYLMPTFRNEIEDHARQYGFVSLCRRCSRDCKVPAMPRASLTFCAHFSEILSRASMKAIRKPIRSSGQQK